jgi:hypothetical protein
MEISVRTIFEQHLTPETGDDGLFINADEKVHEKADDPGPYEDM